MVGYVAMVFVVWLYSIMVVCTVELAMATPLALAVIKKRILVQEGVGGA